MRKVSAERQQARIREERDYFLRILWEVVLCGQEPRPVSVFLSKYRRSSGNWDRRGTHLASGTALVILSSNVCSAAQTISGVSSSSCGRQ